jgi:hypothetical protein
MSTTTVATRPVSFVGWVTGQLNRLTEAAHDLLTHKPGGLRSAEEVLALAEQVESTQPSWAADLRAVAMHMEAACERRGARD